jgi:hypothetical protein
LVRLLIEGDNHGKQCASAALARLSTGNKQTAAEIYSYWKLEKETIVFTGHALALFTDVSPPGCARLLHRRRMIT